MPKKKLKIQVEPEEVSHETIEQSEKEMLQALRKQLADLRVNSISDLDNLIARAED